MRRHPISLLRLTGVIALAASLSGPAFAQEAGPEDAQESAGESVEESVEESAEESADEGGQESQQGTGVRPTRGFPAGLAEARLIREMPTQIGVDEETLEKLEKLVEQLRAEDEELQGGTIEARNATQALLDEPRPDEKKLMEAAAAASAAAAKTRAHVLKASLRIRALLTDEQLEKFMDLRTKAMKGRRRGGRPNVRRRR